jgi:hypothetical protein
VAAKKPADAAKAKQAKQKKIVIGLSAFLVLAMGYAVKTMMGLNSSGSQPVAAPVAASTTPSATPAPATSTPVAAPTLSGTSSPLASAPVTEGPSAPLVAAVKPTPETGQLRNFSLFESKDPFMGGGAAASPSDSPQAPKGGSGSGGGTPAQPPKIPPAPPVPPVTSAVISVNGVGESVDVGGAFPASNPIFQVVSLTSKTASITIVGGSYADGAPTLKLTVNKPVTLQNTADGTKYTLILMPQGTQAPSGSGGGTTTTSTTTPAGATPPPTTTSTTPSP